MNNREQNQMDASYFWTPSVPLWLWGVTVSVLVGVFIVDKQSWPTTMPRWPPPSLSPMGRYRKVAVATDNQLCSEIGRDIMIKGGNAADSAVSTMLCIGVVSPHSAGIGGGHFLTFYSRRGKKCYAINARGKAPLKAHRNTYLFDPEGSMTGWKAIAVPGEIHGLYTLYKRFGSRKLSWSELLQPVINLLEDGYPISDYLAETLIIKKERVLESSTFSIFTNKDTGELYKIGEIMKRPVLATTLRKLANSSDPVALFYRGSIARDMVADMSQHGGLVNMTDLKRYSSIVRKDEEVMYTELGEDSCLTICGPPPPSSAAIMHSILNVMTKLYPNASKFERTFVNEALMYHRFLEVQKFAYANRRNMGDMDFEPQAFKLAKHMTTADYAEMIIRKITDRTQPLSYYETADTHHAQDDHGTSHVSIVDEIGNAVSVTSSINLRFGSARRSLRTGIIFNNEMDDFSTSGYSNYFEYPPSPENYLYPEKRPMSSMSPSVIFNRKTGQVKMVLGAAGGSKIISTTAYIAVRMIIFGETVKEAIDAPRIHNQFIPNRTRHGTGFPEEYLVSLVGRGHTLEELGNLTMASAIQLGTDGFWYGSTAGY